MMNVAKVAATALLFHTYCGLASANEKESDYPEWRSIGEDMYVDSGPKLPAPFGKARVRVLNSYREITSAQMFGLSEVEEVEFDCINSKYVSLADRWFSEKMATGKVTKIDTHKGKPAPIPSFYIKLFASVCSP